jgi:site-specific recombinase XerD
MDRFQKAVTFFYCEIWRARTILIHDFVLMLLTKRLSKKETKDLRFTVEAGTPHNEANARRGLAVALEAANFQDFHLHDLRHAFATRLVQAWVDVCKVQRLCPPSLRRRQLRALCPVY